ncbi:MAG: Glu/Leu/Phe/Val dehydrogenase dimerization domain-containing protein [Acidimicrobiia bacterium]
MTEAGIEDLVKVFDGWAILSRYHSPTDAWIFIALHDDSLGPALGGTRMKVYRTPAAGLQDAMRLARGMTNKWAALEAGYGGGKAVLALSRELDASERRQLLKDYAELLNSLDGVFHTGQDLGTTPEDISFLSGLSPHIHGAVDGEPAQDPSPYTARGVLAGIRAAVNHLDGTRDLSGISVTIQGAGNVGRRLARLLAAEGARVIVSDLDAGRSEEIAADIGAEVVEASEVYDTPCDVLSPCAIGGVLNAETIPRLKCRIVAGSANNMLATPDDGDRLDERGILYVPDYVINAGGAIALGPLLHASDEERYARVDEIEVAVAGILTEAKEHDESPLSAVRRRVERVLEEASGS